MVIPIMDIMDGDPNYAGRHTDETRPRTFSDFGHPDGEEYVGGFAAWLGRNFNSVIGVSAIVALGLGALGISYASKKAGRGEATSKQILTSVEKDEPCPERPFTTIPVSDSLPKRFYRLIDSQLYEGDKVCIYEERVED